VCRLFGMSAGGRRARATFWLLGAPDSLAAQSRREPDGTGLGWFDEQGAPHVRKQPIAAYGDAEQGLWALRYPRTHELHVLERAPGAALEHSSSLGSRVRSEHGANRPLVVVASERMDDDPRWRALRPGELLHVDHALRVSSRTILHGPPARPLTLDDLDARAWASQTHTPGEPGN
jgi:predicted glutamine amidotransferase